MASMSLPFLRTGKCWFQPIPTGRSNYGRSPRGRRPCCFEVIAEEFHLLSSHPTAGRSFLSQSSTGWYACGMSQNVKTGPNSGDEQADSFLSHVHPMECCWLAVEMMEPSPCSTCPPVVSDSPCAGTQAGFVLCNSLATERRLSRVETTRR